MSDPTESPTRVQDAARARADLAAKILADLETLSGMFPTGGDARDWDHRGEDRVNDACALMHRAAIGMKKHADYVASLVGKVAP